MDTKKNIYSLKKEVAVLKERIEQANIVSTQYRKLKDDAIVKADLDMARRLDTMNEFREQLKQQAGTFITREQIDVARSGYEIAVKQAVEKFEALIYSNTERLERVQTALIQLEGRVSTSESADAVAATTASRLSIVENTMSNWQGRAYMIWIGWGVIVVFISWYLNNH